MNKKINGKILLVSIICLLNLPILINSSSCINRKKTKADTKINQSIDANLLEWNNLSFQEIQKEYYSKEKLKEFILENKNIFFDGTLELIDNTNSFDAEFIISKDSTKDSIKIKIIIFSNYWYEKRRIQKKNLSCISTIYSIYVPSINPEGGSIDKGNLHVSCYKNIINRLDLKKDTLLTKINDEILNNKLKANDAYKNLNLKILEGSTETGSLILQLNGFFDEEFIDYQEIEINGFNVLDIKKEVSFKKINLNTDFWFNDLRPVQESTNKNEINQIGSQDWLTKYLDDFVIQDADTHEELGTKSSLQALGWVFVVNLQTMSNSAKEINFSSNLKLFFDYKIYDPLSQMWKSLSDKKIEWILSNNENNVIKLPTLYETKKYLLEQTVIIEEELKKYYPSYFEGLKNAYSKINTITIDHLSFLENKFLDKFKNKYWNNSDILSLVCDVNSIKANDFHNILRFDVQLKINDQLELHVKTFNLENKTKNINNNSKLNEKLITNVFVQKNSSTFEKLVAFLKESYKSKVDELFSSLNNSVLEIQNVDKEKIISSLIMQSNLLSNLFLSHDFLENKNIEFWDKLKKEINPSILDNYFDLNFYDPNSENEYNFDPYSKLFHLSSDDIFVLNNLTYEFTNLINLRIENASDVLMISIPFVTKIGIIGNYEYKRYNSFLLINISKSDWEQNKKMIN